MNEKRIITLGAPQESTKSTELPNTFPLACLPPIVAQMAQEVAGNALVPESLAASCLLAVASASIGAGLQVDSGGGRVTRPNLFMMVIAASGTGKSVTFGHCAGPLIDFDHARSEEWRTSVLPGLRAEEGMAQEKLQKLKKEVRSGMKPGDEVAASARMRELEQKIADIQRDMVEPLLFTDDATREALALEMSRQPGEALACLSADARGAVSVLRGRYSKGGNSDEDVYLKAYSGDSGRISRVNRPAVHLKRPCLTVLWLMQPDAFQSLATDECFTESGLLPRFIIFDPRVEPMDIPEELASICPDVAENWKALIECLLRQYHSGEDVTQTVSCEESVSKLFRITENANRARRRTGGDLHDVEAFASRWTENAWRLSLVLHACRHGAAAHAELLTTDTAKSAIQLMEWYSREQLMLLCENRSRRAAARVARLREILARASGRAMLMSDLEKHHGFSRPEVERLAKDFPQSVRVETVTRQGPGRPGLLVSIPG